MVKRSRAADPPQKHHFSVWINAANSRIYTEIQFCYESDWIFCERHNKPKKKTINIINCLLLFFHRIEASAFELKMKLLFMHTKYHNVLLLLFDFSPRTDII